MRVQAYPALLVLHLLLLLLMCPLQAPAALTNEDVLQVVEDVFPPSDGSTLVGQGGAGVAQLRSVLGWVNLTGCPPFVTPEEWPHDRRHFAACLWAVMGMFANEQVTNGGAFATFALDTQAGVIVRGSQDRESAQSITILSVLIVTLLVAIGMLMFLQSPPVSTYTMDGTRPPASFSAQGPAPLSMPGSGIMMMGLRA